MSIQPTPYTDAPDIGYAGMLTDPANPCVTRHSIAETQLNVGIGVMGGAAITDPQSTIGFKCKIPDTDAPILGITVRIPELECEPPNSIDSVPVYRQGDIVTYMETGSIYVKALVANTNRQDVYVVWDAASTYPRGSVINTDDGGKARLVTNAYFAKAAGVGDIVKVVLGVLQI